MKVASKEHPVILKDHARKVKYGSRRNQTEIRELNKKIKKSRENEIPDREKLSLQYNI